MNNNDNNDAIQKTIENICDMLNKSDLPYGIKTSTSLSRGVTYYNGFCSVDVDIEKNELGIITLIMRVYYGIAVTPDNINPVEQYCGSIRSEIGTVSIDADTPVVLFKASTTSMGSIDIHTIQSMEACAMNMFYTHSATINRIAHGIIIDEFHFSKEYRDWTLPEIRESNSEENSIYNTNVERLHDLIPKAKKFTSLIHNKHDSCDYFVGDSIDVIIDGNSTCSQKFRTAVIARADKRHGFLRVYCIPGPAGILGDARHRYEKVFKQAAELSSTYRTIGFSGDSPLGHGHCAYIDISLMVPLDESLFRKAIMNLCREELRHRLTFEKLANGLPEVAPLNKGDSIKEPSQTDIETIAQLEDAVSEKILGLTVDTDAPNSSNLPKLSNHKKTLLN